MAQRIVNFRGGEQVIVPFSLHLITTSHNPRKPVRRLQRQGIVPLDFLHECALSDDVQRNVEYITKMAMEPEIVTLARSIQRIGQAQPIVLRTFRTKVGVDNEGKNVYEQRGGVGAGERRVLACGLLEAVRRVAKAEGKQPGDTLKVGDLEFVVADRNKEWTVDAICLDRITVEEASEIGWDENAERADMTPLDWGEKFDHLLRTYNPVTQRPYTIQEVADRYGKNYHWVRGRAALPYLPVELQQQVEDGEANITEACSLALRYKARAVGEEATASTQAKANGAATTAVPDQGADPEVPVEQAAAPKQALETALPGRRARRATISLAEVQKLFDQTPQANVERRQAFAEVMGLTLEQASQESLGRKEHNEIKKAREAARPKPAA